MSEDKRGVNVKILAGGCGMNDNAELAARGKQPTILQGTPWKQWHAGTQTVGLPAKIR